MNNPLLDAIVFSSLSVAAVAVALSAAAALAMRTQPGATALALVFFGTLVVYNVDRLRDLPRDRATAPARSRFVEEHRHSLVVVTALAAAASAALALATGPRVIGLLAPVLLTGLFHRRLKRFGWWKPCYVSLAWIAVVVGLPAVLAAAPRDVFWVAGILGATVAANVVASNLRDAEAVSARFGPAVPLRIARGCAMLAALTAVIAPASVRALAAVPIATLAALGPFRADERYGLVIVDGALLVGAIVALALLP